MPFETSLGGNFVFRSPKHPLGVISHSHSHFVIKSMSIHSCIGFPERPALWLSSDYIVRMLGSKLEAWDRIKHWDFQASICLASSHFMMGAIHCGGLLGLIESPYSRLSVNIFFRRIGWVCGLQDLVKCFAPPLFLIFCFSPHLHLGKPCRY